MTSRTRQRRRLARSYSLLLGAGKSGQAGGKFSPTDEARIRAITREHFPDGFTILDASGGWFDPNRGKFIQEKSRQIIVVTTTPAKLKPWCAALARALRQNELLVTENGRVFRFARDRPAESAAKRTNSGMNFLPN